ncbi:MAG: DUF1992 domain-containing protein [Anaerolineales bacterium]|nr:DUF1992 domain-containing protein [Anaerolineales bacterium]
MTRSVDAIIQEAIERGEFDDLPGAGRPIDLSAYFDMPEEVRLAYTILKNANLLPEEAEILKEITALKEALGNTTDEVASRKISKAIENRMLQFSVLMNRGKSRP